MGPDEPYCGMFLEFLKCQWVWTIFKKNPTKSLVSFAKGLGFPDTSVGKESTCHAGDPSSIPGEGIGYPLQYSWASLVAQVIKHLPAMRETWVQSLGWEDPQEKGKATHSSILAWRIPWTVTMGSQRVRHN